MKKMVTRQQVDEIVAYAIAKNRLADALSQGRSAPGSQQWLEECTKDLEAVGISQGEADAYISSRRWFRGNGLFVDLDESGAPSEEQLRAYCALSVAADKIGTNNYRQGIYKPGKFKVGKPLAYQITEEHQAVIDAMSKVLSGLMSPEEAMALLHEYDVMKQRIGYLDPA